MTEARIGSLETCLTLMLPPGYYGLFFSAQIQTKSFYYQKKKSLNTSYVYNVRSI